MKRILLVAGARPNFMKLAPLYGALRARRDSYRPVIVHTGQHYDRKMSDIFFEQLRMPRPDFNLNVGSGSHGLQTGKILIEIEKLLISERPDMVVVFGDVNSTLAAAIAAVKLGIPVAHVEAGLRSNDWSMPEEINRIVADRVSTLFFTTCEDANINLIREGVHESSIHFVGNTMIDSLCKYIPMADRIGVLSEFQVEPKRYVLVTLHRPGNVDDPGSVDSAMKMISGLSAIAPVVFPVHPRTRKSIIEYESRNEGRSILDNPNLRLTAPVGYLEFIKLEKEAAVVVTDSGGVQEETTFLGTPCLTTRPNTERPVTITDGTNTLVGMNPKRVIKHAERILRGEIPEVKKPLLWDGQAAGRIVGVLNKFFSISPLDDFERDDAEVLSGRFDTVRQT